MDIIVKNYSSQVGDLLIGSYEDRLCLCDWRYRQKRLTIDSRLQEGLGATYQIGTSPIIEQAIVQLEEYFRKERQVFDIPLLMVGTDFQKQIWNALVEVPYGTTETYQKLSERINNPKAIRAVASANGANAISIFIPCHRIIGSDKSLVGYAGGTQAKKDLLDLESNEAKQLSIF